MFAYLISESALENLPLRPACVARIASFGLFMFTEDCRVRQDREATDPLGNLFFDSHHFPLNFHSRGSQTFKEFGEKKSQFNLNADRRTSRSKNESAFLTHVPARPVPTTQAVFLVPPKMNGRLHGVPHLLASRRPRGAFHSTPSGRLVPTFTSATLFICKQTVVATNEEATTAVKNPQGNEGHMTLEPFGDRRNVSTAVLTLPLSYVDDCEVHASLDVQIKRIYANIIRYRTCSDYLAHNMVRSVFSQSRNSEFVTDLNKDFLSAMQKCSSIGAIGF